MESPESLESLNLNVELEALSARVLELERRVDFMFSGLEKLPKRWAVLFEDSGQALSRDEEIKATIEVMLAMITERNKTLLHPVQAKYVGARFGKRFKYLGKALNLVLDELIEQKKIEPWYAKSGAVWLWSEEGFDYCLDSEKFNSPHLIEQLDILPTEQQMESRPKPKGLSEDEKQELLRKYRAGI